MSLPVVCCLSCALGTVECWGGRQGGCGLELCVRLLRVCGSPLAVCLVSLFVSVCRSCVSSSSVCLASTHTALVSSPSLAVLHLSTYLPSTSTASPWLARRNGCNCACAEVGQEDGASSVHAGVASSVATALAAAAGPAGGFQGRCTLRAPVGTAASPLRHPWHPPSWRFLKRLSSSKAELLPASLAECPL